MTCFKPLTAYKSQEVNPATGKHLITFNPMKALIEASSFKLPCNQCGGCRADKARDLAVRVMHEAQMHEHSCFLTLTYSDECVPASFSVSKREFQLVMKRIRKEFGSGIKYLAVGEYSDAPSFRPHYHAILAGLAFPDRKVWRERDGHRVYRSAALERLWPHGLSEIGSVTSQSAGYVARYCMKKLTGELADAHYWRASPIDGAMHQVEPEFALMSRRPALGLSWLSAFKSDVFPSNFVVVDGRKKPVPRFYLRKLAEDEAKLLKRDRLRKEFADLPARRRRRENATSARLAVREAVHAEKQSRLVRTLK